MASIHDYLPKVLQDVKEFRIINEDLDIELQGVNRRIDNVIKQVIVADADLYGIEKWEKTLGLSHSDADSLELRRFRIINFLQSKLPYTYRWLVNKLIEITGSEEAFTVYLDYDKYELSIVLSGMDTGMMAEIQLQLRNAIPANIELLIGGPMIADTFANYGGILMYGTKYKIDGEYKVPNPDDYPQYKDPDLVTTINKLYDEELFMEEAPETKVGTVIFNFESNVVAPFTYELIGDDKDYFEIVNNEIKIKKILKEGNYNIGIKTTDIIRRTINTMIDTIIVKGPEIPRDGATHNDLHNLTHNRISAYKHNRLKGGE